MPHFYETEVRWGAERQGDLRASGLPDLRVATPPEFNGHRGIWTPEHYLVGAVTSCLMTTFLAIAEASKLRFLDFSCTGRGKLDQPEGHAWEFTEIVLVPRVTVVGDQDRDRALRLLAKAERNCLISRSLKAAVVLEPLVLVAPAEGAAA